MAAAFVKRLTPGTRTVAGTTCTATVPVGGVAQGNRLLIGFGSNSGSSDATPSLVDSRGNVYTPDKEDVQASRRTLIYSAPITTALLQGDVITATFVSTGRAAIDVLEFSGLLGLDVTNSNSGTGAAVTSGNTPQRNFAKSVQFGVVCWNAAGAGEVFTVGGSFIGGATVEPSVASVWRDLGTEYQILAAGGALAATGTIGSATTYTMLTAVYIDATQPSAGGILLRPSITL